MIVGTQILVAVTEQGLNVQASDDNLIMNLGMLEAAKAALIDQARERQKLIQSASAAERLAIMGSKA